MNTINKVFSSTSVGVSILTLFMSAVAANAGGIIPNLMLNLPADFSHARPIYEVSVVNAPSDSAPLEVRVVNSETGQPVTNAHVKHWIWADAKSQQQTDLVLVALKPTDQGTYVCDQKHILPGAIVQLRAHVPNESSGFWTTIGSSNIWSGPREDAATTEEGRQRADSIRVNPWLATGAPQANVSNPAVGVWPGAGAQQASSVTRGFHEVPTNLVTGEPITGY